MTEATKELATNKRSTIRELITGADFRRQIATVLPRHVTPERFVRVTLNATMREPKLFECTRESLFKCLLDLSAVGLEPDNKRAFLIPFWNSKANAYECTLLYGYQGLADLVWRGGGVTTIEAHAVYERDHFEFRFGSHGVLDHEPTLSNRGDLIAAYSFVRMKEGEPTYDVMGREDIDLIRARSKTPDAGPWKTDFAEMARKTVFRRHSKWLPISAETREAIDKEDNYDKETFTEQERFMAANPARVVAGAGEETVDRPRRGRPPKLKTESEDPAAPPSESPTEPPAPEPQPVETKPADPEPEQLSAAAALVLKILPKLAAAGETSDRFLAVLRDVKMIGPDVQSLDAVPADDLQKCLDDWENVLLKLEQMKPKK